MPLIKDKGIVVGSQNLNEADVIITLISEYSFKKKLIIKGLKKSKKRAIAASEPGSYVDLEYYNKDSVEILYVKDISIIDRFEKIKSMYGGYLLTVYICELVDRILQDKEDSRKIFNMLNSFMKNLELQKYSPVILPYIKIKLMSLNGIIPVSFNCSNCGKDVFQFEAAVINHDLLVICSYCRIVEKSDLNLIYTLELFLLKNYRELVSLNIKLADIIQADKFLNQYLGSYLGKDLQSFSALYQYLGKEYELSY